MNLSIQKVSKYVSKGLNIDPKDILNCFAPATKNDLKGLIKLRKDNLENQPLWDDRSYLKWRYGFDKTLGNNNRIWVFKINNTVLACLGVEEVTLCLNKEKITAHKVMDLLVHQDIEGIGLSAWMSLVLMEKYSVLFATGATRSAYTMISKLFYEMEHRQTFKMFIRINKRLESKLKNKLVSKLLSMPINLALSIYQALNYNQLPDGYTIKLLDSIPGEIDTLLDDKCEQNRVQRTKKYLDWRLIDNPRRKYAVLGLYVDDKLAGVSFSTFYNSDCHNQKDGFIIDWVFDKSADPSSKIVHYMLQETVKFLKKQNPNSIFSSVYDSASRGIYKELGFIERDYNDTFFAYTSDKSLEQYLYDHNLWYLTESDANTDLY